MKLSLIINYLYFYIFTHSHKIQLIGIVWLCCSQVEASHLGLLIMAILGMWCYSFKTRSFILHLCMIYISCLLLAKMLYQTNFIPHIDIVNCTHRVEQVSDVEWFGFNKLQSMQSYFLVLAVATFLRTIHLQLINERGDCFREYPVLFTGVRRVNLDYDIVDAIKYLINYVFFKFGLEICQIGMAGLCYCHVNVLSLLYGACLLVVVAAHKRSRIKLLWPILCIVVAASIIYQYLVVIGFIPSFCVEPPWKDYADLWISWLYLPHRKIELHAVPIICDSVLLLLMRQQSWVFQLERKPDYISSVGSNDVVFHHFDDKDFENPVPDHTLHEWVWIDLAKMFTFSGVYWGGLAVCFMAGLSSDLLSIGYLAVAFFIASQGADLYLSRIPYLVKWWRFFCCYSAFSITLKCAAADIACSRLDTLKNYHWTFAVVTGNMCQTHLCFYSEFLVFCFFIFQMRFFQSPYFLHHVNDVKASLKLRSSGAALIRLLRESKMKAAAKARQDLIMQIKEDMGNIKAYHQSVISPNSSEPVTHDHAVYAGDYYMFESGRSRRVAARKRSIGSKQRTSITFDDFVESLKMKQMNGETAGEKTGKNDEYDINDANLREQDDEITTRRRVNWRISYLKNRMKLFIITRFIPFLNNASKTYRLVAWTMKKDKTLIKTKGTRLFCDYIPMETNIEEFQREEESKVREASVLVNLIDAIWFAVLTHTELLCYIAVLVHEIMLPSLLSLPLPLLVLMWGALTPSHPSHTFWTTLTTYTQTAIILKCLARNEAFPWSWKSAESRSTIFNPSLLGIEQRGMLAAADVLLLIVLFMHREKLKNLGLWEQPNREHEVSYVTGHLQSSNGESSAVKENSYKMTGKRPFYNDSLRAHFKPMYDFLRSFSRGSTFPQDVYTYVFLCDFLTFIIIFFGFSSFSSQAATGIEDKFYLVENEVPTTYLTTLILQFIIMLIDRVIYLKRNIRAKLVFHIILVLVGHIWIFLVLPSVTSRRFQDLKWPQMWYTFKFLSFLFSAYQLRTGFPDRVGAHFLCSNYKRFNQYSFLVLTLIPFFNPIRQILNWLCYNTSLTLYEWQRLCSMNKVIFQTKCQRKVLQDDAVPRGHDSVWIMKLLVGGSWLIGMLLTIWAPLFLFSIFNSVSKPSPPTEAIFNIRIGTYQDLYHFEMGPHEIKRMDASDYDLLRAQGRHDAKIRLFLDQYDHKDVSVLELNPASRSAWTISPAEMEQMEKSLNSTKQITLEICWTFRRQIAEKDIYKAAGSFNTKLTDKNKHDLMNALNDRERVINIATKVPLYIESKKGRAIPVIHDEQGVFGYDTLELTLKSQKGKMWWEIMNKCENNHTQALNRRFASPAVSHTETCKRVIFRVFTVRHIPAIFEFLTTKGIIGVYVSFVLLIWTVLRNLTDELHQKAQFTWLPNPDPVLQLSKDIHLARECGELQLEEDLYAKLVFLFRSPETMIKWTKFAEDAPDDDDEGVAASIEL